MKRVLLLVAAFVCSHRPATGQEAQNADGSTALALDCFVEVHAPSGFPVFSPSLWGTPILSPTNSASISVTIKNRSRQLIDGVARCSFELISENGSTRRYVSDVEVPGQKYPKSPVEFVTLPSGKLLMANAAPKTNIHLSPGEEMHATFRVTKLFWTEVMRSFSPDETLFERVGNGPCRLRFVVHMNDNVAPESTPRVNDVRSNEAYVLVAGSKKQRR